MPTIGAPSRAQPRSIQLLLRSPASAVRCSPGVQFVSLGALSFERSAELIVILVIGGTGRLYGGVVGAIVYGGARPTFRHEPAILVFLDRPMLISVVLFLPNGILAASPR
jgi:branched-chain amino acid transport system permease protein